MKKMINKKLTSIEHIHLTHKEQKIKMWNN